MRIIAGTLKGRRLTAPTWDGLRPTSDKLRETLFNVLAPRLAGARVLDLFAGTGGLGLEAVSRGAVAVVLVDDDRRACDLSLANARHCGVEQACAIIRATAVRALKLLQSGPDFTPFDIVLLDPPYDQAPASALEGVDAVVSERGVVVLEHARRTPAPDRAGRLVKQRELRSGDSALSVYTIPT